MRERDREAERERGTEREGAGEMCVGGEREIKRPSNSVTHAASHLCVRGGVCLCVRVCASVCVREKENERENEREKARARVRA